MSGDDRKLSYSERDKLRREGGGTRPPRGKRAKAEDARRTEQALKHADSLFTDEQGGQEGKALADAVREAHGTAELPAACRAYFDAIGAPHDSGLASIFLDASEKDLSVAVLDALLRKKAADGVALEGGLKRQIRILSEDFDDDLASRAEELLE